MPQKATNARPLTRNSRPPAIGCFQRGSPAREASRNVTGDLLSSRRSRLGRRGEGDSGGPKDAAHAWAGAGARRRTDWIHILQTSCWSSRDRRLVRRCGISSLHHCSVKPPGGARSQQTRGEAAVPARRRVQYANTRQQFPLRQVEDEPTSDAGPPRFSLALVLRLARILDVLVNLRPSLSRRSSPFLRVRPPARSISYANNNSQLPLAALQDLT